jgi:hypothetical protein
MAWRAGPAAVALAALLACGCGDKTSAPSGETHRPAIPERLPDLDQVAPRALSIVGPAGEERLTFLSAVENVGRGPLVIVGERTRGQPEMTTRQLVRRVDGTTTAYPLRTHLRFVVSETHRHWHLLGFESYELLTADGKTLGRDHKTGFCLGDRYDARADDRIPGEPRRPVWTQECGLEQPGRLRIREGISPGFGDDYVPLLEGQYIDVAGLPAGRYVLVHRVDGDRVLREASQANNAASVLLRLRRAQGRTTVAVLATCPDTPRCS